MEKFKKFEKEFCITDESVNVYGYRCLTSGFQLDEVKKNPIGFYMHKRDNGVVVRWEDFRVDGTKVYAKPVVNLSHPDGQKIADEIESGFLNGASAGKIVCLAASDDPKLKLPGQTSPTVTKWYPREISLVDIPGNYNAVANLFDENDNELDLADFVKPKKENMSKILMTAAVMATLNLSDDSSQEDFNKAIEDLIDTASKVPKLTQDLAAKTAELNTKEIALTALKAETVTKEVEDLIAKGQSDKKLTKALADTLKVDYAENPSGLKNLIDAIPAQTLITDDLADKKLVDAGKYAGKKWDDLYASNDLETVRTQLPDLYDQLKKEKFPNQTN